ncbi:catalase-2-like [Epargyreus clarus]|uniref:catalase-2-like n=1 Tax=Epargyreus clarus TaxID=520877 RepID=UPI003C2AB5C8
MKRLVVCVWFIFINQLNQYGVCDPSIDIENLAFLNRTTPSDRQLYDFRLEHPEPIGITTTSSGLPVEIRDTTALNMNQYKNQFHVDLMTDFTNPRIPERVVHAKGTGAWGYFEVLHDVSKYTTADIFNGIGKKTPAFVRFSQAIQNLGGYDTGREQKALSVKFFTREGNLDFLSLHTPVYFYKDAINFEPFAAVIKRNPKTFRRDFTALWDFISKKPETLHATFWLLSDYGLPNGYRKADYFPIQTYEIRNKHGDRHFVRFNFRTCQGIENLSDSEANLIIPRDPDYYNRDLYDSIEEKNYPSWDLEMDVLSYDDVRRVNYDPFDVTRLWKRGTYHTIQIGRLTLNRNPDNFFRDVELAALNPSNLVPGIPGPIDSMFRARRFAYRQTQIHRLGINHNRIHVNTPLYREEYNRDGKPPVLENMKDAPMYFPNSFNGPVWYVDESRPKDSLSLLQSKAVDLEVPAEFYHNYVVTEDQKGRFVNNTIAFLLPVAPYIQRRAIRLFTLVDPDLGRRLTRSLLQAEQSPGFAPPRVLIPPKKHYYSSEYNMKLHG